jgi:hypothetical protein
MGAMPLKTHGSSRATLLSIPFKFAGLAFEIVFATAASSRTARSASFPYASRVSFISCEEGQRDVWKEGRQAHLDHLTYLCYDLGRRLQATSDYGHRLYARADEIERGDGEIKASHACRCVSCNVGLRR